MTRTRILFWLRALAFCLLAMGLNAAFWAWLGRGVALPDVPAGKLDCLSYTPHDNGRGDPRRAGYRIDPRIIEADITRLSTLTRCVRLYSARGSAEAVLTAAEQHGMTVILGAWLSSDDAANQAEITAAVALSQRFFHTVRWLVIGNEVLLRRELSVERLSAYLEQVQRQTWVPVAYADVTDIWLAHPELSQRVDAALVHFLPYWGEPAPSVAEAQQRLVDDLHHLRSQLPDTAIVIGETGWPSAGPRRQAATPGRVHQARFIRQFVQQADTLGVPYNLIEALDQPWKRDAEGTVGGHWGLLNAQREAKFPLQGPVSEWPFWPLHWLVAALLGLTATAMSITRRPVWKRVLLLALAGQALGSLLVWQWHFLLDSIHQPLAWLWGLAVMTLSASNGLVLFNRWARGPQSRFAVAPQSLRQVFTWLRQPRRATGSAALTLGALQGLGAFLVASTTLSLAVEARHQDIPVLLFLPSAALALMLCLGPQAVGTETRREEAWLALAALLALPFCFDGFRNLSMLAWMLLTLVVIAPWRYDLLRLCRWQKPVQPQTD